MVENHVPNHILNRVIVKNQDWQTKNQIVLVRKEKPPLGPNGVIGQSARDIVENKVKLYSIFSIELTSRGFTLYITQIFQTTLTSSGTARVQNIWVFSPLVPSKQEKNILVLLS